MNSDTRKNFIYNLVFRLSIIVLPLIVTPYIARVLGVDSNGLYSFSSTIACYFIIFGKLGLDNYGNRSVALCLDDIDARSRVFFGIYTVQLIASAISILFYILSIFIFFSSHALIYWMQLFYVISVLFDISWFFYGMEKFKLTMIRSIISRLVLIAAVFVFVKKEGDLWIFTMIMSLSFLFEQLMLFPFIFKHIKFVKISAKDVIPHLKPTLKLFLPILALSIYHWMDKIMLGLFKGNDAVAYYNYAESIVNLPKGIVLALGTVMLPKLSYMAANNQIEDCKETLRKSMKFIGFISCLLCFGIAGVAPIFVPFFLGQRYIPTIALTMQLSIVLLPMSISDVIQTQYLIPFKRDSIYIYSLFIGALINLILNSALIGPFGASGVIISTIIANTSAAIYQIYRIRDVYSLRHLARAIGPFIVTGLLEFAVIALIGRLSLSPLTLIAVQVIAGTAVYALAYLVYLMVFKRKEGGIRSLFQHGRIELP